MTDEEVNNRIFDIWQDARYFKMIGIMDKDRAVYRAAYKDGVAAEQAKVRALEYAVWDMLEDWKLGKLEAVGTRLREIVDVINESKSKGEVK